MNAHMIETEIVATHAVYQMKAIGDDKKDIEDDTKDILAHLLEISTEQRALCVATVS